MNWIRLKSLKIKNFGPFEGSHQIDFPESGLVLLKGLVTETGDGSGAGKSYLLKGVSYLFGGCPDPSTEIQSWFTDEPPESECVIETTAGDIAVKRKKGLSVGEFKGRAAESELDKIFGMDEKSRAIITYRGQRKPGMFLSLSDEKKKSFLWNLLDLSAYERVVDEAKEKAEKLAEQFSTSSSKVAYTQETLDKAREALVQAMVEVGHPISQESIDTVRVIVKQHDATLAKLRYQIDSVRKQSTAEENAILAVIRSKVDLIAQRGKPIEITGLEVQLEKLRGRLQQIKDYDTKLRIGVEANRNDLKLKIAVCKSKCDTLPSISENINRAKAKEKTLLEQKCSECKRQWTGQEAEATLKAIQSDIVSLESQRQVAETASQELAKLKELLAGIKDPEPHPDGKKNEELILATTAKIKEILQEQEGAKREELYLLKAEEREVQVNFAKELAQKLQELNSDLQTVRNALELARKDEQWQVEAQSQQKAKDAIARERRSQVDTLEASLRAAIIQNEQNRAALQLENDVVALVGRTGFLGAIVEEVLSEIAAVANEILSQVANVRHLSLDFETEKEAASTGNVTARIVPVIYSEGRRVSFTSGISGGMQAAVELAVDLAVGDVISRRKGCYPNFLVLDECFDGLGGVAKESCLEMLQSHAGDRLILVVDHDVSFQGLFPTVVQIEMTGRKSRIVV